MTLETHVAEVTVAQLSAPDAMLGLEELQREIWGYGEPGADPPYPARALFAISESGGLVSLATVEGAPAGFCLAWLGRTREDSLPYLHSQLVGVRPAFRKRGVGFAIKLHQRDFGLSNDLSLMRWTFDPLRAANARLNLGRLGALCQQFRPHYYGHLGSRFGTGDQSDRLWAEWHLNSSRVKSRIEGPGISRLLPESVVTRCRIGTGPEQGLRVLDGWNSTLDSTDLAVEIPVDFETVRGAHPELARSWRLGLREILEHYLRQGWAVSDLNLTEEEGHVRAFYTLRRSPLRKLLSD
jgi:predicted GNAT superfamily acetyltransferase